LSIFCSRGTPREQNPAIATPACCGVREAAGSRSQTHVFGPPGASTVQSQGKLSEAYRGNPGRPGPCFPNPTLQRLSLGWRVRGRVPRRDALPLYLSLLPLSPSVSLSIFLSPSPPTSIFLPRALAPLPLPELSLPPHRVLVSSVVISWEADKS